MGDYVTVDEVIAHFDSPAEVAALTGDVADGTPDHHKVERAIAAGEFEINARIGSKYVTGETLVNLGYSGLNEGLEADSARLAVINLIRRGRGIADFKLDEEERILDKYDRIAEGKLVLPASATIGSTTSRDPVFPHSSAGRESSDDTDRLFTRDKMSRL